MARKTAPSGYLPGSYTDPYLSGQYVAVSNGVTQDATSGWLTPSSNAEWTTLLAGTGLNVPSSLYGCQDASGSLLDSISARNATFSAGGGAASYSVVAAGWSRKGVKVTDNTTACFIATGFINSATTSIMQLQILSLNSLPASGFRHWNCLGTGYESTGMNPGPVLRNRSGVNTAAGVAVLPGSIGVITKYDRTNNVLASYCGSEIIKPTYAVNAGSNTYILGDQGNASDATLLYSALWIGADAEISDASAQAILSLVRNGH